MQEVIKRIEKEIEKVNTIIRSIKFKNGESSVEYALSIMTSGNFKQGLQRAIEILSEGE